MNGSLRSSSDQEASGDKLGACNELLGTESFQLRILGSSNFNSDENLEQLRSRAKCVKDAIFYKVCIVLLTLTESSSTQFLLTKRRGSQVVRPGSAKAVFAGSIPAPASNPVFIRVFERKDAVRTAF